MKLTLQSRLIHSRRTLLALLALAFATAISVLLLVARAIYAHEVRYKFLTWNLVLAWIPLLFALAVYSLRARRSRRWLLLSACAFVWFFFYPNAPYLITDLIHLKTRPPIPHWFDIILFMSFAWTGLFLGYLSLYLMQEVVRDWLGHVFSWQFAIGMLALGALGVFLGRFWRWNSWEIATHPFGLASDAMRRLSAMRLGEAAAFATTFFVFSAVIYATLYTITHLHGHIESRQESSPPDDTPPCS